MAKKRVSLKTFKNNTLNVSIASLMYEILRLTYKNENSQIYKIKFSIHIFIFEKWSKIFKSME